MNSNQKNSDPNQATLYFRCARQGIIFISSTYFRVSFSGFENVPKKGPYIVAPNHQSFFDPFWVSIPFGYPLRYMTWDKFANMPILGGFIRSLGAFPVKLEKGDRTAMKTAAEHLGKGGSVMVFPEGGRTCNGEVAPFKPGVIKLAIETKVPIIPVTISGGFEVFSPQHNFPRPGKIHITYHAPFIVEAQAEGCENKEFLLAQAKRLQAQVDSGLA